MLSSEQLDCGRRCEKQQYLEHPLQAGLSHLSHQAPAATITPLIPLDVVARDDRESHGRKSASKAATSGGKSSILS